jgi:hypothetical protein
MAASFPILMFMMLAAGNMGNDLVTIIDAKAYFQARQIQVTPDKLAELATKDPVDGKTQLAQLLALRQLGEDAAEVKKAKNYQEILKKVEEVADGKKAQDPQGFAAEYARLTLATLRGDKLTSAPGRSLPENSVRQDALTWFPASVKLVAAMDYRPEGPPAPEAGKAIREMFAQFMLPEIVREEFYKGIEKIGNVRVDRFAIAYTDDPKNPRNGRIYMRLTGKGDHKRLAALFKEMSPQMVVKEQKGFRGQKVTLLSEPNSHSPGIALVGETDLIVAGIEGRKGDKEANPLVEVEEMLAVRAGKEKSVVTGPLAESLKKISPKAVAMAIGELPEEMRAGLTQGPQAFRVFPKTVFAQMLRKKDSLYVHWKSSLDNADDAKRFVEDVARLKKLGIDEIKQAQKNLPPGLPIPPKTFENLTKILESVKAEAKDTAVSGSITVPADAFNLGGMMGGFWMGAGAAPPPPPPKIEIKKPVETKKEAPPEKGSGLRRPARPLAQAPAALTMPPAVIACLHERTERRRA